MSSLTAAAERLPPPYAIHADRGTSMTSKPVSTLLSDLVIYYNHEHRHSGTGLHTPYSVHIGTAPAIQDKPPGRPERRPRREPAALRPPPQGTRAARHGLDQQTGHRQ